jgi:hypothetical protein
MLSKDRAIDADPLFARVCAAGGSLRRLDRSEKLNAEGQRSIWHQGKELTELISWEDANGAVQRQELSFLGLTLDYRRGKGLRTGTLTEERSEKSLPTADLIHYDVQPSLRVLELAARLLRESKKDFYTQHLLQQLNDALTTRFNRPQTQVYGLARWRERLRRASDTLRHLKAPRAQVIFYVTIGAAIGALITVGILALL